MSFQDFLAGGQNDDGNFAAGDYIGTDDFNSGISLLNDNTIDIIKRFKKPSKKVTEKFMK